MHTLYRLALAACLIGGILHTPALAADDALSTEENDRALQLYFEAETTRLDQAAWAEIASLEHWQSQRAELRRQLFEMLGLDPLPERTELQATVTGKLDHEQFTVENIHFQSRPGLYVTGNLYLPKNVQGPVPTIVYVCGHAKVILDGVSYGNKTHYQHHGIWFAQHGYACFIIDTLQLGEIQGLHHGTHNLNDWWWNSRGYTPAGVEAWNAIRALDYLETRPEVDTAKFGVTGRSGGGAHSWYLAALDDRIKVAVPVAGITDLGNHVVDNIVAGHCDCMYTVNTYGWDYGTLAALVAPRPLLFTNTDRDGIFPLDGVMRIHQQLRQLYQLHKQPTALGLQISSGGHQDLQELQLAALRWFDQHLKGIQPVAISSAAEKLFTPQQLKVFDTLPTDQINTSIQETFTVTADSAQAAPAEVAQWNELRDGWKHSLTTKVFRGWPSSEAEQLEPISSYTIGTDTGELEHLVFESQKHVPLNLYLVRTDDAQPKSYRLHILDQKAWDESVGVFQDIFQSGVRIEQLTSEAQAMIRKLEAEAKASGEVLVFFTPRGIGASAWNPNEKTQNHIRRKFMLLGQTVDSMRVWDTVQAIKFLQTSVRQSAETPVTISAQGDAATLALYASLFTSDIADLRLNSLPVSHRHAPDMLNVQRFVELPQVVAMAAENQKVTLTNVQPDDWKFAADVQRLNNWPADRITFSNLPTQDGTK